MASVCTICRHEKHHEINEALVRGSESQRAMGKRFGVSHSALQRHLKEHVPVALAKARESKHLEAAETSLDLATNLLADARRIQSKAETAGDLRAAIASIRELVRIVELMARLEGKLAPKEGLAPVIDLSRLTDAELATLEITVERATIRKAQNQPLGGGVRAFVPVTPLE